MSCPQVRGWAAPARPTSTGATTASVSPPLCAATVCSTARTTQTSPSAAPIAPGQWWQQRQQRLRRRQRRQQQQTWLQWPTARRNSSSASRGRVWMPPSAATSSRTAMTGRTRLTVQVSQEFHKFLRWYQKWLNMCLQKLKIYPDY